MNKTGNSRGPEIDIDKCVTNVGSNRFDMVIVAAERAREIKRQHSESDRREHIYPQITALLDIQSGEVGKDYLKRFRK